MLTKLIIENFKRFGRVEIELGNPVVFIGPNNSGKTSALQALALWQVGLSRWIEKRKDQKTPEKRPGVTISRRDIVSLPIPSANLLWKDLDVRKVRRVNGKPQTNNVYIDIIVEGVTENKAWECGLEFYYANEESFYCRPLRLSKDTRMPVPKEAEKIQVAFLSSPMSGLVTNETRLDSGAINVRIGEGRTAEVLRNLCYRIYEKSPEQWKKLVGQIGSLFGSVLTVPEYLAERGEIIMGYREHDILLNLFCSGRGMQQTLFFLAYLYANPNAVLLLDEPDAHLEILRQGQIYQLLTDVACENNNQLIIATHSEKLLNEASDRDVVVAFLGKPHRVNDRKSQVLKSLRDIGYEHYYLAEQTGWILYLEGPTDLAILRAFAETLSHQEAIEFLKRPFVYYVGNQPNKVRKHFYGLREAVPQLVGVAIFDKLHQETPQDICVKILAWQSREIENYLCFPETLDNYAKFPAFQGAADPLFAESESALRIKAMQESINEVQNALEILGKGSPWDKNTKVSDNFLEPLFETYFKKLRLPNIMDKKSFHKLTRFVPKEKIDSEVKEKLETIVEVAKMAKKLDV
ncbi:AAA family ATPase [bacterium]|nr:AAA family ATPase [bacterium]